MAVDPITTDAFGVVALNTIKSWFLRGLKPTQGQFNATWNSFWHKHQGVTVKHPTTAEINAGLKQVFVQTNAGNVAVPTSGGYGGNMQDLADSLEGIVGTGLKRWKNPNNSNNNAWESGDMATGWFNEYIFFKTAEFISGDPEDISSWNVADSFDRTP